MRKLLVGEQRWIGASGDTYDISLAIHNPRALISAGFVSSCLTHASDTMTFFCSSSKMHSFGLSAQAEQGWTPEHLIFFRRHE